MRVGKERGSAWTVCVRALGRIRLARGWTSPARGSSLRKSAASLFMWQDTGCGGGRRSQGCLRGGPGGGRRRRYNPFSSFLSLRTAAARVPTPRARRAAEVEVEGPAELRSRAARRRGAVAAAGSSPSALLVGPWLSLREDGHVVQ